jgi:hypothetical protein
LSHPLQPSKVIRSHGGSFAYKILGPVCILYDREELPWPSCSMQWKGKQPSWNRIGKRFVPDLAASRCPSYAVDGVDLHGHTWTQVQTLYYERLSKEEKAWWYSKVPIGKQYPELPDQ